MSDPTEIQREPTSKEIGDLASALMLAKPTGGAGGGAVFLIGAGCSVSAGIQPASGVAKHCAKKLANKLSNGSFAEDDPDAALTWLLKNKLVTLPPSKAPKADGSHWSELYNYFFESHFQSANMQRDIINEIIEQGGEKLNWAHACLGELVRLGFVHTVLTTNFDQLVLQGIIRTGVMPVTADGLDALNRIVSRPKRPQVVHMHGSMHTYDLRNSSTALAATSRHSIAQAMIHTLMKECDILVVVGYSGGEEGIMTLLQDAGRTLENLVIYWVTYTPGSAGLRDNAKLLLAGENKFVIWGGPADRFFGDLMSEMKIGEPEWVKDPIKVLKDQSKRLQAPGEDSEAISILVDAFKSRVEHADRPQHRWAAQNERKVAAAERRARGDFRGAYAILDEAEDREADFEVARLHALNALSLYETESDPNMLEVAVSEFEGLIAKTEGEARLDNILSLGLALLNQSEHEAEVDSASEAARKPLDRVVSVVRDALPAYRPEDFMLGNARLNLLLAQALQSLGERKPVNRENLERARESYELAIDGLQASHDPVGFMIEAKAGLAAVYQVLGEDTANLDFLREAVCRHREVAEITRKTERAVEDAGPLMNLANALMALAKASAEDCAEPYEEARNVLNQLVTIHEDAGDKMAEEDARKLIAEIDVALD